MEKRAEVDTQKWHVGQEVTLRSRGQISGIHRITKITKTQIHVQTNDSGHITKFNTRGEYRLDRWSSWRIEPTTDKDRAIIERWALIHKLKQTDWSSLTNVNRGRSFHSPRPHRSLHWLY